MPRLSLKTKKFLKGLSVFLFIFLIVWLWPASENDPEYGITFSARYATDLGLDAREVYRELLDDMSVRQVRLVAYWDEIESVQGEYDFSNLDWQITMSEQYGADVILSLGRRVPRWPECHIPEWAYDMEKEKKSEALKEYVGAVVERYKGREIIEMWQVENEAFFTAYASEICGINVDEELIDAEIEIVRDLDPTREIMMTDSGNLGLWGPAYKRGDVFGSTFYVYLMFDGKVRSPLTHNYYKLKKLFWSSIYGKKDTYLIEISVEPWLKDPILETPIDDAIERLPISRVNNIISFAQDTGFDEQYFWGVEWHYYMKQEGHPEYWDLMKELFNE